MVLTRSQYENMSKEELIEQLVSHDDIAAKLSNSPKGLMSSLISMKPSILSSTLLRITNTVSNSQYHRRETLEINPVPSEIQDNVLEETVCQALSLTGINVFPDELHSCHRLNKKDRVIVKFKCRKHRQNVLYNLKNLQSKGLELTQLKFSRKVVCQLKSVI